jgi:hypothetical protein
VRLLPGLLIGLLLVIGCGPAVPREELGTIEDKMPKPLGTEEPYDLPELRRPADAAPDAADLDKDT